MGQSYSDWALTSRAMATALGIPLGSVDFAITTWPPQFQDGHAGEPALRFSDSAYAQAFNGGYLPTGDGTRSNGNGYTYVLGQAMTGDDTVVTTSPHIMTAAERAANAAFSALDGAANAIGLPSLNTLSDTVKAVAGIGALIGLAMLVSALRKR